MNRHVRRRAAAQKRRKSRLKPFRETCIAYGEGGDELECAEGFDGAEYYIEVGGKRIAVRGDGVWVSLVPGWTVETSPDYKTTTIEYRGPNEATPIQLMVLNEQDIDYLLQPTMEVFGQGLPELACVARRS